MRLNMRTNSRSVSKLRGESLIVKSMDLYFCISIFLSAAFFIFAE